MKLKKKSTRKRFSTEEIDKIVESQAEDDSAWGKPIKERVELEEVAFSEAKRAMSFGNGV